MTGAATEPGAPEAETDPEPVAGAVCPGAGRGEDLPILSVPTCSDLPVQVGAALDSAIGLGEVANLVSTKT